jgi:CheY-like chemotaxis protein
MANVDAATIGQWAVKLGLLTLEQLQEGWDELGARNGDPEDLLRILERKRYLTPWQSSKLLKSDPDGYFLGGYRILYKIASGSFGRVFRADDPRSGTVVAIKVLRRKWSENRHNIELFEREGKMGMALRHPNVVEILAVNRDPQTGQYYIVMEFVEGNNLRDFLAIRKKLEPAEALRILEEATAGLAYAYSRGLTHRDMKLSNILMSSSGTAKLVDFGLAAGGAQLQTLLKDDNIHVDRTVDYAGLEKATGVPPGDTRSDIFFLGCVLYELVTGRSPLTVTRDARERMKKERFSHVRPIEPEEVGGNTGVIRLITTMMSLNPMERYQTPSQLLDAIRKLRRELEGKTAGKDAQAARAVFVVENDVQLQDAMREKFREMGYRVFIASDPGRALDRFRQQPYDALVVDAGTVGEDGKLMFERVLKEADRQGIPCAGILILSEGQESWAVQVPQNGTAAVLQRPLTLKQLYRKLDELVQAVTQ